MTAAYNNYDVHKSRPQNGSRAGQGKSQKKMRRWNLIDATFKCADGRGKHNMGYTYVRVYHTNYTCQYCFQTTWRDRTLLPDSGKAKLNYTPKQNAYYVCHTCNLKLKSCKYSIYTYNLYHVAHIMDVPLLTNRGGRKPASKQMLRRRFFLCALCSVCCMRAVHHRGQFFAAGRFTPATNPVVETLLHTDPFTHRRFYTQTLLHTKVFTHRPFYTQTLLHTETFTHRPFYTQTSLHRDAFTHRRFYTQTHRSFYTQTCSHRDGVTHRPFYTQTFLHTNIFTKKCFYAQTLLHRDTFTHRHFYTQTLVRTNIFRQTRFYTQTLLHKHTLFHTDAFTHKHVYTQTLLHTDPLHTEAFSQRPFYTQTF